jgi:acetoin utilization deacetylase AcuC-like enzyme
MTTDLSLLYDPIVLEHRPGRGHPERPERVEAIMQTLRQSDIWDQVVHVPVRPATHDELLRVHSAEHVAHVEQVCRDGGGVLDAGDTIASAGSGDAALAAAGAAIGAVDAVMTGNGESSQGIANIEGVSDTGSRQARRPTISGGRGNASQKHSTTCRETLAEVSPLSTPSSQLASFAVVRPPGHHATPTEPMGFCLFNNVAVAAAHAMAVHGVERILLVDFDVHHGNGTQDAFYNDPRVLFFSAHQHPAYPGTGALHETGGGDGRGYTINVPVPAGVGDDGYDRIFDTVLQPAADRFQPQLVLVSAGYDAHWRNGAYVGGIDERVTIAGFTAMARKLQAIAVDHCQGRIAAVLEGGYDLESLGLGVLATLKAWLGQEAPDDPIGPPPRGVAPASALEERLVQVRAIHGL